MPPFFSPLFFRLCPFFKRSVFVALAGLEKTKKNKEKEREKMVKKGGLKKQKKEEDGGVTLFSKPLVREDVSDEEEMEERIEKEVKESLGGKVTKLTEEKVKKDIEQLPSDDQFKILEEDSSDYLPLVKEFRKCVDELKQNISPLMQKLRSSRTPTSKGMSYLELKHHLLLAYCTNVSFYMLLKASGKQVEDHPVINQLIKIRIILEKMRPLDQKLKYQVDKLLKAANQEDEEVGEGGVEGGDAIHYKPNPNNLLTEGGAMGGGAGEEGEDGLYKPPRISEVPYLEKGEKEREEQKREKRKKRVGKSSIMDFIREEYGEEPTEMETGGAGGGRAGGRRAKALEEEREREKYEQERFIRLPVTKKDRQRRRELEKVGGGWGDEDFEDFGQIASFEKGEKERAKKGGGGGDDEEDFDLGFGGGEGRGGGMKRKAGGGGGKGAKRRKVR